MRRAGLYLRISKDWKGDAAGVDRQREDGARLIEARGWKLHRVYIDNDISASGRRKRPDYAKLLADMESGEIDAVVSRSFERLCKSRREQLTFVELGQEKRTPVIFTHAPDLDLTSAIGRGLADMMAAWARVEMEQKSERHVDQIAQAARRGRMVGGVRAFGYSKDGLSLDPVESVVVRQLYDRWLTGESMGSMARWLNQHGMTTPQGNSWKSQSVREVLANPRNAALRGMRDVVNQKTGTRARWHRIIGPAVWPAIVPEETWRAALDRIKDPHRPGAHVGRNGQRYLLSGIGLCGVCERPLITGGRNRERLLRCPSLRHISRRADLIEDYVTEVTLRRLRRGDAPSLAPGGDEPAVDLSAIRSESIELRARLEGLARDYADGVLDRAGVKTAGDRIRGRLTELDRQVIAAGQVDVLAPLRAASDPERVWEEEYPMPQRREVIRRVMSVWVLPGFPGRPGGLRFHPETVRIEWHV